MNLCGHATIGSMYCLKTLGMINETIDEITIETNVGILPITFEHKDGQLFVTMKQDHPQFIPFQGNVDALAKSIGLKKEDIDDSMPIVYGSTGAWTLLIPIKSLKSFSTMRTKNEAFPTILTENSKASVHPFSFEKLIKAPLCTRGIYSPFSGTTEDPVTGTASGVMGAYYLTYINKHIEHCDFVVEQGQKIHKDGRVYVSARRTSSDRIDVFISGTGVFVREMDIPYA